MNIYVKIVQAAGLDSTYLLLGFFGSTLSTLSIHYFLSPYVSKIYLHRPIRQSSSSIIATNLITPYTKITIENFSIICQTVYTTLELQHLKPVTNRRFLTWAVKENYLRKLNQMKNNIKDSIDQEEEVKGELIKPPKQKRF
ncbi:8267_t:CDS:2, partial [Entrophospora sp. SA101]